MIICSCNGLSDRDVHAAIQAGVVKISEIYSARQCRVKCGNCVKGVACLLKEARQKNCACPGTAATIEQSVVAQMADNDDMVQKKEASL
ncbi:(2Fe-2S)-binding protein [Bombella sp. TMW 2.2559]|uniref:(2Fe-2S)-binding protein n=1 Tax=Bombella dulcis TaxID=2967339 RepID=A0ABT3WBH4_9PROT|nr:(2Fe-2S)-binding protein [Bombella dulcis]MCX5615709.1 (2Fe-2S)-binding protein [Bombella dulcis]